MWDHIGGVRIGNVINSARGKWDDLCRLLHAVEIIVDGMMWLAWHNRCMFTKEFSIAQGHSTRTIHTNYILIELSNFNDGSRFVPFFRMMPNLVLNSDKITNT